MLLLVGLNSLIYSVILCHHSILQDCCVVFCFFFVDVALASLTPNYCKTPSVKQPWILLHQNYEGSHHTSLSSDFLSFLNAPLDAGKLSVLPTIHLSADLIITTLGLFKNASD